MKVKINKKKVVVKKVKKEKKVKKHLIQMLVGKVMVGEVRDIIDIDRFIKRLKKRMKVETL